ncbi:porin [Bordetella genomosp. 1]|uniref:Porin n=1 Tax=Bordetella genomosp. 1 TaxID=1395607 RepID=A0A261STA8_9BORD|nr:porin [Bordetella genomosp. 1]MDQ8033489.1 porin [Bordetella sp.]OZI40614.1 porin [Bordetella genomosp. 1]OZI68807.1 porin [Bordetella genomosp. 1]
MKRLASAFALAGLCAATGAQAAESSVTLYGIADISLRYLSTGNGPNNDNSRVSLENGAISNSRFGLRGVEDLGNGYSTFFRLEGGFNVQNGQRSDPDSFFNRHAYVGIDGKQWGAISLGRQDTPMFTILADQYDPLTVGNYVQNSWLPVAMSRARSSNSVRYRNNQLAGFDVILSYAFSDSFEDHKLGRQYGGTLSYTTGPFSIGGGYQLTNSAADSDLEQRVWNVNASYNFDPVKVFAGYFNGRDETGWVNAVMGSELPTNGLQRKDNGYFLGATWQATPRWAITGAGYYDRSENVQEDGDKGKRYAFVVVAEYALSKRTQLYGTVDYNKVKDAASEEISRGSQVGAGVGIRHIF